MINFGTWNICLGLKSKKDYVRAKIKELDIDILLVRLITSFRVTMRMV